MASYKKMYEAAMEEAKALQQKIDEMASLDSMMAACSVSGADDRQFLETFIDKCNNRAEIGMLVRILNRLGA